MLSHLLYSERLKSAHQRGTQGCRCRRKRWTISVEINLAIMKLKKIRTWKELVRQSYLLLVVSHK